MNSKTQIEVYKHEAINDLLSRTRHDVDFYVLLVGSILLAAFAIFNDSVVTLIASMIVSPLATPILTLGLGIASRSWRLIGRSFILLCFASAIALLAAVVLAVAHKQFTYEMIKNICNEKCVLFDVKAVLDKELVDARL